jgi:diguanylate cyclase (GGDEF)-like protein/PAS domain S-box-containing protein
MIAISAFLFLAIFSYFFYQRTYQNEIRATTHSLSQLIITVESSAAIACYLNNIEIATEVVQGLERNDMVSGVSIRGSSGLYLATGSMIPRHDAVLQQYPVGSPVGDGLSVGQITINPNQQLIEQRARQTATIQVQSMAMQTLIIVVLVMLLVYWQLTKPIRFVAQQLHELEPGSRQRLCSPAGHRRSEIGGLVVDSNQLLETVENAITKERDLRAQVEFLERRFRLIFEHASGGIALTSINGKLLLHNPAFEKMVGSRFTRDLMESGTKILPDIFERNQKVRKTLQQIPSDRAPIAMDLKLLGYDEGPRWLHCLFSSVENEDGDLLIETICYDISARTLREKKIQLQADRDPLTGLLNRRGGTHYLNLLLERCRAENRHLALLMIDLDRFKPINDTFGHESGDKVLCEVAGRMLNTVRQDDLVIRLGGDEFLIALVEGHGGLQVAPVAGKILHLLREGIDIGEGQMVNVGASVGIALYPEYGEEMRTLMDLADNAMYKVKNGGRNGYCFAREEPCFIDRHTSD